MVSFIIKYSFVFLNNEIYKMDVEFYFGVSFLVIEAIDLTKEFSCVRMVFMWLVFCFSFKILFS